jgi:hypothetical protein
MPNPRYTGPREVPHLFLVPLTPWQVNSLFGYRNAQ